MKKILKIRDLTKITNRVDLMRGIHYSAKFESLYVSVPKCGCSSIKTLIQAYEYGGRDFEKILATKNVHNKCENKYALPGLELKNIPGLTPTELLEKLTKPDVFRYTFVRNPYARILSAYKDKILKKKEQKCNVVCRIYPHFKKLSDLEKLDIEISFSQFVEFVTSHKKHKNADLHWRPQTSVILYDYVDYNLIGRLENSNMYWHKVYDAVYASERKFIPLARRNSTSQISIQMQDVYTSDIAERVFNYYERDFLTFDYSESSYLD